jgi:NitT/TauT family transport system substrate-binding protein
MRKKSIFVFACIIFLAAVLFGCGKSSQTTQGNQEPANSETPKSESTKAGETTVSLGLLKFASGAPFYIAEEKGFFKEEGINLDIKWFDASNPVNVAVASNNLDAGAVGLTADLYNMIAAGQKVTVVSDKGKEKKGYNPIAAVVVHKDSPIKEIEDLKGKKVGVTTIGSSGHYSIGRILENHGLSLKDIQLVPMNTTQALAEALKGKQLDAVVMNSTNINAALKDGYGKVLVNVGDEFEYQSVGIFVSPNLAQNKDLTVRFLRAYLKGAHYFDEAVYSKKDGKLVPGENYDEVVKITAETISAPEDIVKGSFYFMEPDGKLNVEDIQRQLDWFYGQKLVSKKLDIKDVVNTEFLDEALKTSSK